MTNRAQRSKAGSQPTTAFETERPKDQNDQTAKSPNQPNRSNLQNNQMATFLNLKSFGRFCQFGCRRSFAIASAVGAGRSTND